MNEAKINYMQQSFMQNLEFVKEKTEPINCEESDEFDEGSSENGDDLQMTDLKK